MKLVAKPTPRKIQRWVVWDDDAGMPYYASDEVTGEMEFSTRAEAESAISEINERAKHA